MSNDLVVVASASLNTFESCLKAAAALQEGDDKGVITILSRAAAIGITDMQADVLIKALARASGIRGTTIRGTWRTLAAKAATENTKSGDGYGRRAP